MQYINEAKRWQKLAGIITEETAPAVDANIEQDLEKVFGSFLSQFQSAEKNVKPSPKDGQLDEIALTLTALAASAPGLLQALGKGVNWIANQYSVKDVDKTSVGTALQKVGHKLEHKYIESIAGWLKLAFPKKYGNQDPFDETSDLHDKAHGIYAGILAAAAISSGVEAAHAVNLIVKGLEGGAAAFKTAEVVALAQKVAAV